MEKIFLVYSHTHLMDEAFEEDQQEVIARARENGVEILINVGYSKETSEQAVKLAQDFSFIFATIGLHPDECNVDEVDLSFIKELAKNPKVVAIGEVGLDYHYDSTHPGNQKNHFIEQIELANELKLPVAIHSRDCDMDMLSILKEHPIENGFVMHCFSSSVEVLKEMLKLGAYISLAGPVTYKNARQLLEVATLVPLDKLLVETDAPYLTPEPHRGKRNESAFVKYTAMKIAELRNMSLEELAKAITENAKRFYHIDSCGGT